MHRLRGKLTYPNVVSTLCLILLLGGGTAYAASKLGKNSVGAKQLKKGAVTPAKLSSASKQTLTGPKGDAGAPGAPGARGERGERGEKGDPGEDGKPVTELWAIVSAAPVEVLRGRNVESVDFGVPTGSIRVTFNQDVRFCSYEATVGAASNERPPEGTVAVSPAGPNFPDSVNVYGYDREFLFSAEPFHLAVFC